VTAGRAALAAVSAYNPGMQRLEASAPSPFLGPRDFAVRLFVEQWVTFPRYVLSGGFARAWRESGGSAERPRVA
jgi:hypothetical protein